MGAKGTADLSYLGLWRDSQVYAATPPNQSSLGHSYHDEDWSPSVQEDPRLDADMNTGMTKNVAIATFRRAKRERERRLSESLDPTHIEWSNGSLASFKDLELNTDSTTEQNETFKGLEDARKAPVKAGNGIVCQTQDLSSATNLEETPQSSTGLPRAAYK